MPINHTKMAIYAHTHMIIIDFLKKSEIINDSYKIIGNRARVSFTTRCLHAFFILLSFFKRLLFYRSCANADMFTLVLLQTACQLCGKGQNARAVFPRRRSNQSFFYACIDIFSCIAFLGMWQKHNSEAFR